LFALVRMDQEHDFVVPHDSPYGLATRLRLTVRQGDKNGREG
jgi:hypothetical protein